MSKERLEKSERTPTVSWRPWALAYSRYRLCNFSCLSAPSKNGRLRNFFWTLRCQLASQSLSRPAVPVLTRNKSSRGENESNCSMTSECVRTDSILPRGAGCEHGRRKQSIFSLSIFGIIPFMVERLSFWPLIFCSDFVTVFLLSSSIIGKG